MKQKRLRVWDKENKEYVTDELFFDINGDGYFLGDLPNSKNGRTGFALSKFVIERTTNMHDINGEEIFEGDIVNEIFNGEYVYVDTFKQTKLISVVKEDTVNPTLLLHRNNSINKYDWEYDFSKTDLLQLEIIGNIHKNTDLLTN